MRTEYLSERERRRKAPVARRTGTPTNKATLTATRVMRRELKTFSSRGCFTLFSFAFLA